MGSLQKPEKAKKNTKNQKRDSLRSLWKRTQPCQHFEMHFKTSDQQNWCICVVFSYPEVCGLCYSSHTKLTAASLASSQHRSSWAGIISMDPVSADTQATIQRSGSGEEVGQKRVTEGGQLFGSTSGWGPWTEVQPPVCCL